MSITVDTVNLRFKVTPDYNQQQIQQLQSDLKQSPGMSDDELRRIRGILERAKQELLKPKLLFLPTTSPKKEDCKQSHYSCHKKNYCLHNFMPLL